jgi:cold-inducible RNA-binding protein
MNGSKIYVGNLPYTITENELHDFFSQYGNINNIKLISDNQTGRLKGFGFITYSSNEEGNTALDANGEEFNSRPLIVSIAKESPRRTGARRRSDSDNRFNR